MGTSGLIKWLLSPLLGSSHSDRSHSYSYSNSNGLAHSTVKVSARGWGWRGLPWGLGASASTEPDFSPIFRTHL